MKSDALFVNTSRAELVEPDALYRAMTECQPALPRLMCMSKSLVKQALSRY